MVSGSSSSSSMSTLLGSDGVSIKLYGDDLKTLQTTAKDMAEKLATVDGIDETDSGIGATSGEIKVTVDKTKAAKNHLRSHRFISRLPPQSLQNRLHLQLLQTTEKT